MRYPAHFASKVRDIVGLYMNPTVDATLGSSRLSARGSVIRPRGKKRRTVALDVVMAGGRIEDLLLLSVKSPQRLMRGEIGLRTKMEILPQEQA